MDESVRRRVECPQRADVAQLARASPCHGEGRGFESLHPLSATGVSGSASVPGAASAASGHLAPIPQKPKKHKAKKKAHKAQAGANTCQLQADVTVAYSVS